MVRSDSLRCELLGRCEIVGVQLFRDVDEDEIDALQCVLGFLHEKKIDGRQGAALFIQIAQAQLMDGKADADGRSAQ